jgi:hypothetical protein
LVLGTGIPAFALQGIGNHDHLAEEKLKDFNTDGRSMASVGFEENKGQVRTTSGEPADFVRYRLTQGNTQLFLLKNGIAYQFNRVHYPADYQELVADGPQDPKKQEQLDAMREEVRLETYRMNMLLQGADQNARITTEGRSNDYTQYYNHDALDVHSYSKVTYHDVYPGIDWVVYTTAKGMKYDFVVRPGADPDQIRLRFEHHEELSVDAKGNLIHGNRMGRFTEERPVSFQDGKEVPTSFVLEGNMLRFVHGGYDRNRTLTIDPDRIWGTYYGGSTIDFGYGCATDADGNVYLTGIARSTTAIAANGHQNTNGGADDAFLVKFNSEGQRLWGTYYGGSNGDGGRSCAVDGTGNVYMAGFTGSTTEVASIGHQNAIGGQVDGFLVKFNSAGTRLWATYYGGTEDDAGYACAVDGDDNVYMAGSTWGVTFGSQTGIASGGHQMNPGGLSDNFLVKFNSAGVRQWGTYYGGDNDENGEASCAVDDNGNVYLAGRTRSTSGIAEGGHQLSLSGPPTGEGYDTYLVKFNDAGQRQWGTYYGGQGDDYGFACAVDGSGNVYLAGATNSATSIAESGHQNTYVDPLGSGTFDGFLVKFNSAGQRLWGTYYGGDSFDEGSSCAVDANDNVYLGGYSASVSGIAENGFQNTLNSTVTGDGFLAKFTQAGTRIWGTYYGGEQPDYVVGCAVDPAGDVYIAGRTRSTTSIAEGGHQNTHGGGFGNNAYEAFLVKLEGALPDPDCSTTAALQETEPNNSNSTANALPYGTSISGSLGACTPTDNTADYFSINTTGQGVLRVEACLSTTGSTPLDVTFRVRVAGAGVLATYTLVAGANGEAITSSFEFPCQGIGNYFISVEVPGIADCMSYAFSYTMLDPVFGNDPFPNTGAAHDTYQDGQNGFYFEASTNDSYNIIPPFNGVMTIEVQAEHSGLAPGTMEVRLYSAAAIVIQEWIVPTGASGVPITTTLSIGCRGYTTNYDVRFNATECGTSYRWKYTMTAPLFATDPEPNNGGSQATPVAYDTFQEGQNDFNGESNSDYYVITPTINGVMHIEVQAEHAGNTEGAMQVSLAYAGVPIERDTVPVGANGQPITTTIIVPCRGGSTHNVVFNTIATCGTSYRWRYYTTDPYFANDVEPNNTPASAIVLPEATDATGHLDFLTGVDNGGENNDFYRIDLPTDGVLHVNIEAEHTGASATETVQVVIVLSNGTALSVWDGAIGANSTPVASSFSLPCRGTAIPYHLRLISGTCGTSYRVSWNVTPAFYANDAEPNNSYSAGITTDLSSAWYDGHIGFYNTTDDDYYKFTHAGGPYSVTVSAEHAGTGDGTMEMAIVNSAGSVLGTFVVPVGGSSTALTNTFTQPTLTAGSLYALRLRDVTCGVSYRIHCATDADNDGVCDVADLCTGGPEPGTPCDDGDPNSVNDIIGTDCTCSGDFTTGIGNDVDGNTAGLRIWPNPNRGDRLWVSFGDPGRSSQEAHAVMDLFDLSGKRVLTQAINLRSDGKERILELNGTLETGTYLVCMTVDGARHVERLVIQP